MADCASLIRPTRSQQEDSAMPTPIGENLAKKKLQAGELVL
jgi:hypothetical protein